MNSAKEKKGKDFSLQSGTLLGNGNGDGDDDGDGSNHLRESGSWDSSAQQ